MKFGCLCPSNMISSSYIYLIGLVRQKSDLSVKILWCLSYFKHNKNISYKKCIQCFNIKLVTFIIRTHKDKIMFNK